ncbi:hypothetical protein ACLKA6_015879 [Drosophila palustris]
MNAAKPQPVPQAQHDCSMNVSQRSQLPKMRLPKFSGKHSEFRNFMCLFESLVDDDASLTNVEKFNHLVSCLSDEALGVVKPYPLTDCNYPKALASLKSVYDNKCLIFFDTVAQLFDIPSMTKPSASSLRSMIDTVSAIYASLSSLGDEKDISNAMIIHMVMAKVDHVTKSKFEEQLDYDKLPSWEDCAKQLNRSSEVIKNCFYVDDMLAGADSLTELDTICSQVTEILHSGGFPLAKWASNRHNQSGESDASEEISIKIDEQSSVKTLGMRWAPQEDVFKYHLDVDSFASLKPTKRNILSIASRLFDPLGLLCPIVTKAKMLLQELWRLKVDWDEAIPMSLHTAWNKFITTLRDLHKISIPRYVCLDFYQQVQVHGFADASSHAYGCCIYIRTCNNKDVGVSLLTAKSRVAPLNVKTIPRLELCAALLLAKLWQQVSSTMTKFTIDSVNFWSDSQVTLYWLERDSCTLGTFVANRVAEAQELSNGVVWRHVPTDSNPADLVSRGTDIYEIVHWKTRIAGDDVQRQRNELRGSEQRAEGAAGGVSGEQGEADGVRSGESGAMEVYPSEGTALRRAVGSSSKAAKHRLVRGAGNANLTPDELSTHLVDVEALLNSRPLVADTSDPNDGEVITPGHLLIGQPLLELPHGSTQGECSSKPVPAYLKRWRQLSELKLLFWRKWSRDYLLSLQQRVQWSKGEANLVEGAGAGARRQQPSAAVDHRSRNTRNSWRGRQGAGGRNQNGGRRH